MTDERPSGATQPRAWVADLERLGARVVEARVPEASANTWPQFQHEALQSHAATWPSRADEYGELMQKKLRAAERATPEEVEAAYRAIDEWRRYEPEVDLYVSPCYAVELPDEDADELEVRLPLTSFLRWTNLTGWAGLAIGNMQLVAPRDEVVLAAGLAWERALAVDFRILGPLEVWDEGAPIPLRGAKQRALLAVLALHANEVVSTDRLSIISGAIEQPGLAELRYRVRVSQLRKALRQCGRAS